MLKMRSIAAASVFALGLTALAAAPAGAVTGAETSGDHEYVVLFAEGVSSADAIAAVEAAGGTVVAENEAVGVATAVEAGGGAAADRPGDLGARLLLAQLHQCQQGGGRRVAHADHEGVLAGEALAVGAQHVGQRADQPRAGLVLTDRRQPGGAEGVRPPPCS